jgi:predicted transcriptional regulator YdeE
MNKQNPLKIVGISTRTRNEIGKPNIEIMNLWAKFMTKNISEQIKNKASHNIYSIYTDYESNFMGEYTVVLGFAVEDLKDVPPGLVSREFQEAQFKVIPAHGAMPDAVIQAWIDIWNKDSALNRAYSYDFELYTENSQKGDQSVVDIYLSVK